MAASVDPRGPSRMDRDYDDGNHPLPPSKLHSPLLRKHARQIAAQCFARIYATWPELDERYGERGRRHTAEDNFWHLEYLDTAIAAGEPGIFRDYVDWLVGLLTARGLDRSHVAGAFGFLAEGLAGVDCPAPLERHRRELVGLLRGEQARVSSPGPVPSPDL